MLKISDVIKELQAIQEQHGDLDFLIARVRLGYEERLRGFRVENRSSSYYQGYFRTSGDKAVEGDWE